MSGQQISEADVVDTLLGQAKPEVMDRLRTEAESNPEIAELWQQWTRTLPVLKEERKHAGELNDRVRGAVMAQLVRQDYAVRAGVRGRRVRSGVTLGLVAAVCAMGLLVVLFAGLQHVLPRYGGQMGARGDSAGLSTVEVAYAARAGVGHDHRKDTSGVYANLAEAIEAVPTGGVLVVRTGGVATSIRETPRLTKPMRIEARGAPVRLGLFPNHASTRSK